MNTNSKSGKALLGTPEYKFQMNHLEYYQQSAIRNSRTMPHVLLFDDPGLGKTIQTVTAVKDQNLFPALVTCPKTNIRSWEKEINKWYPNQKVIVQEENDDIITQIFKNLDAFFIISHSAFARMENPQQNGRRSKRYNDAINVLKGIPWGSLIVDEAHFFRNITTMKTQGLLQINAKKVFIVTGTPIVNRAADLLPIVKMIDVDITEEQFNERFSYHKRDRTGRSVYDGLKNERELRHELLADYWIQRTANQVKTQLPPMREIKVDLNFDIDQALMHDKILEEGIIQISDAEALEVKQVIIAIYTRLRQVTTEPMYFLKDTDSRVSSVKREAAKAIIQGTPNKVLACSNFNSWLFEMQADLESMGIKSQVLTGKITNPNKRQEIIDNFNNDPEQKVFLINMQMGVGLNLPGGDGKGANKYCDTVIIAERWWNSNPRIQMLNRARRMDSYAPMVNVYDLRVPSAMMDTVLLDKSMNKDQMIDQLMNAAKNSTLDDAIKHSAEKFYEGSMRIIDEIPELPPAKQSYIPPMRSPVYGVH